MQYIKLRNLEETAADLTTSSVIWLYYSNPTQLTWYRGAIALSIFLSRMVPEKVIHSSITNFVAVVCFICRWHVEVSNPPDSYVRIFVTTEINIDATMSFNVETFTTSPSVETLNSLKKVELLQLAEYYGLATSTSMGKSQIKRILLTHLVEEEIIPSSEVTDEITRDKSSMTGEELLQLKRLEMEERGRLSIDWKSWS